MKTIIVPTDFSPVALNAANYAAGMACMVEADLLLLHVYQLPFNFSEVPVSPGIIEEIEENILETLKQLKAVLLHTTSGKIKITTELRSGVTITEIGNVCEVVKPYAVIMATQGAGTVERFLFGSHTVSAIKCLQWPLIIVPRGKMFRPLRQIGLACELNDVVENLPAERIINIAKDFGAELHILFVKQQYKHGSGYEVVQNTNLLRKKFKEVHPIFHTLNEDNVNEAIDHFVETNNFDLLIVFPKIRGFLDSLFLKSHTKQWVFQSHVPLMTVHD